MLSKIEFDNTFCLTKSVKVLWWSGILYYLIYNCIMETRTLVIKSSTEALSAMIAMFKANMIDNDLVVESVERNALDKEIHGTHRYDIKLGWLARTDNGLVGCPCFACDFAGVRPTGERVKAVVYVKIFATRALCMCTLIRKEEIAEFKEIKDGETFTMHDELGRFVDEDYRYLNGEIIKC